MSDSSLQEFGTGRSLKEIGDAFLDQQYGCKELKDQWFVVMTESEIQLCVQYIAQELNKQFVGQPIVLCGILKGAYLFLSDLTKLLKIPYTVYFVEASSYGDGQTQMDQVQLLSQLVAEKFHNRKCILLDELFDHGKTMTDIAQCLISNPDLRLTRKDIFTCTLFSKHSGTKIPPPELVGMNALPGVWLVGYGLDGMGEKRGWPLLFACPKIEGVPRVDADNAFGKDEDSKKAMIRLRTGIVERLEFIKKQLSQE